MRESRAVNAILSARLTGTITRTVQISVGHINDFGEADPGAQIIRKGVVPQQDSL